MAKRKFRFNLIDAVIILIVLAAVAIFGYVFLSEGSSDEKPEEVVKIQYVLQTVDLEDMFAGSISENDIIYESSTKKELGKVVSVTDEPAYFTGTDRKNSMHVISEIEGKCNLFVTVEAEAESLKNGYEVDGSVLIVGGTMMFETPNLISNSNIISIEVVG